MEYNCSTCFFSWLHASKHLLALTVKMQPKLLLWKSLSYSLIFRGNAVSSHPDLAYISMINIFIVLYFSALYLYISWKYLLPSEAPLNPHSGLSRALYMQLLSRPHGGAGGAGAGSGSWAHGVRDHSWSLARLAQGVKEPPRQPFWTSAPESRAPAARGSPWGRELVEGRVLPVEVRDGTRWVFGHRL